MPKPVTLGCLARDSITGYTGTVTARVEYLTGCTQLCIVPKCGGDGKAPDPQYFDEQRVEWVAAGARRWMAKRTGGPQRDQPAH